MNDRPRSGNNYPPKNILVFGAIITLVGLPGYYLFQSQHKRNMYEAGYCNKTEEYTASQDAYDAAIEYILDHRSQSENLSVNSKYWPDPRLPKYVDVADFRKKNPNCCLVDLFEKTDSKNSVYYGDKGYAIGVHVRETVSEETSYFSTEVNLNTCGEIIGASYSAEGFGVKGLQLYEDALIKKYQHMPSHTFVKQ